MLTDEHAFSWGYIDALDPDLNGICLIWSWGLPFLPGARERKPAFPSLNISAYEKGRLSYYALCAFDETTSSGDVESARFGNSEISVNKGETLRVDVLLNTALPGGQNLRGSVSLEGVARRDTPPSSSQQAIHGWSPQSGPSTLNASLQADDWNFNFKGRGYFDRNFGSQALWNLGIDRWLWGRFPFKDEERIFYMVEGEHPAALGVSIDSKGNTHTQTLSMKESEHERTWTGAKVSSLELTTESGELFMRVKKERVIDHAPFYARYFAQASTTDESAMGTCEVAWPDRLDRPWQRFFARQRVTNLGRQPLLSRLFTGNQNNRWRRFLGAA